MKVRFQVLEAFVNVSVNGGQVKEASEATGPGSEEVVGGDMEF